MKRIFTNPDGGKDGVGIFADRIETQIFTDSLRSHTWAQMRENFSNANGREWPRIFANPDGLKER
jgi:hypothetical protein